MTLRISLACERYDRVQAIFDGRVRIEGCEVTAVPLSAEEAFHRAFNGAEFDVTEISCSSYMMTLARGENAYVAAPAFVSKAFRHSAIYVRADRGIATPQDLVGKRIGLPEYQMTACLWARGILEDEYGVRPRDIAWFSGGQDEPGRKERARLTLDPSVSLTRIPHDRTLTELFELGELDGLITARVPRGVGSNPVLRRLFDDPRAVERDYYRHTGIFPPMHMIGIRRSLAEQHPWLPVSVYKAFVKAKQLAALDLDDAGVNFVTLPWVREELLDAQRLFGADHWSYGVEANRAAIEAMARYSFTQGLSVRHLTPEEMFHPGTLEMSRV